MTGINRVAALMREEQEDYYASLPITPQVVPDEQPKIAWPTLDEVALYGLVGDIVSTIAPHSESDPVAILIQMLTVAGNMIGRSNYYLVESDRHHANLFAALVGIVQRPARVLAGAACARLARLPTSNGQRIGARVGCHLAKA